MDVLHDSNPWQLRIKQELQSWVLSYWQFAGYLHAFDVFPDHFAIPFTQHKRVFPPATEVCPQLWAGVDFAICASSCFSMYGIDKIVHSFFNVTDMLGLN